MAIRLPGRETRFREPPYRSVEEAVPKLLAAVQPLDRPHAWFGHSMGAVIAYEACRALDPPSVTRLVVAARPAPHLADDGPPLHDAPTAQFLAGLRGLNGLPADIVLPSLAAELARPAGSIPMASPRQNTGGAR